MTEFKQLTALAFHAEKAAARRLAIKESISVEQALKKILQGVAGHDSLAQLLAHRQTLANANVERLAKRRQKQSQKRALKSAQNRVPDRTWLAWFDGSARPNPGRCGIGVILKGPNGEQREICRDIGHGDSSDAEYGALIATLELALQMGATPLLVYGDSQVVIGDVSLAECIDSNLVEHRVRAQSLINQLQTVRLCWIPRHKNAEADMLSQLASSDKKF
ncbi:MAG: ribonuclease HI family protein [Pseudomonadota bacterium]